MRRRAAALLGAFLLTGWVAATAFAVAPVGQVTVKTDGCSFTVHIDLDQAYDVIAWKVKQFHLPNWKDGLTVLKGSGPTDPDGIVDLGPFTLPEGHYNVVVDNEATVDGSSLVVDFWLSCPAASTPAGSEAPGEGSAPPSSAPSSAPSEVPSGSELPAAGSPPPSGAVEGITVTPPPTDTMGARSAGSDTGWRAVVAALGILGVIAAFVRPTLATKLTGRRRR